jgi:hypothetical protein
MKIVLRAWIVLTMVTLIFSIALGFYAKTVTAQGLGAQTDSDNAIRQAVQNAIHTKGQGILGFQINNVEVKRIFYAKDGRTAVVWLVQRDQFSGDVLGREPSIAIARSPQGVMASPGGWAISFETPNSMNRLLTVLPPELVTNDLTQRFANANPSVLPSAVSNIYTGYKLPWSTALRIRITGSIGHFLDYGTCAEISCRYAYDFWNPDGSNRMFPLLASKGGTVVAVRKSCSNGDPNCTNYLVLRDNSTTPTTYQLYYHLAHNSSPLSVNQFVSQGQFIGNTDDTGVSSDHHLHFMVYETPTGADYYWGKSVRILFDDVHFNGNEPRTCAETIQFPSYGTECSKGPDGKKGTSDDDILISENVGTQNPTGELSVPFAWTNLTSKTLDVSGTASDSLGVSKVEVIANYDGTWKNIGNADYGNGVFAKNIDVCAAGLPDGPVSLAVRIWNLAGNMAGPQTGLRQIFNNANCGGGTPSPQVPACTPSADEVALYSEPGLYGFCQKFPAGQYSNTQLGAVDENKAASIQVGANVRAVLYDLSPDLNANPPTGRLETFAADDLNLADNRIGAQTASALWVMNASDIANPGTYAPILTFPGNTIDSDHDSSKANPANPKSSDSLVLAWTGGRGATLFSTKLEQHDTHALYKAMSPQNVVSWSVGSLPAGTYDWTVTACSGTDTCGAVSNSTTLTFTVDAATLSSAGQVEASAASFDMQSGAGSWVASGLWRWGDANRLQPDLTSASTKAWIFNSGSTYNSATARAGDLTSPPIHISSAGNYYLHLRFFSGIEGPSYAAQTFAGQHWDQRRVQVSINGGAFNDINSQPASAPLSDDAQNSASFWPNSPDLPLGGLSSGQIVRVRFHFDTIDELNNDLYGWAIDDVSIDTTGPITSCNSKNNDSPATATALTLDGAPFDSLICPRGDIDYYSFSAAGGTPVRVQIDAKTSNPNDPLDSFMQLIDSNGNDVLAANDDLDPNNTQPSYRDSQIQTTLPRTGTYYIRVKAWDYPGSGGLDYAYKVSVHTDANTSLSHPVVKITKPLSATQVPKVPFIVEASASDIPGSSIQRVDFYWHDKNWDTGSWFKFASDNTPSDGFWSIFNPTMDMTGGAFYAMATNNLGGTGGASLTGIVPDTLKPTSAMLALPATVNGTAVKLSWTTPSSDIDHFEFQYRLVGGTTWTDWPTHPAGYQRSAWFAAAPGSYEFHMRAVDAASNQQDYSIAAETSTNLTGACVSDSFEATNNSRDTATPLAPGELRPLNLCQADTDWVNFSATKDQALMLLFPTQGSGAALHVRIYDPSGANILAEASSAGPGSMLVLRWSVPETGTYSIQITSSNPDIYGSEVTYAVTVGPGGTYYFPIIDN